MWLVREVGKSGGLLCRTELALDIAVAHYETTGVIYEVVERDSHEIADPSEA
jgi:hypothetical protein